ncbi:HPr(Ser) kinase/phosphatase [Anaerotignum sp.]|nr:HPr(Ser) kinase/phosphatase [Anaerotignum sp.]MBO5329666.1 HPr(Ser) kinase/phosphatase [Anaerotignum sp.]MBP3307066.1 HPr(Ser) kinase/phosphatase [Anaerotignum sp.]MBP3629785.1 HPr(Ser) kinase/phosphatase [Anaerotignum sp.]
MYSAELGKIVEAFQLENILPEISLEGRAVKKKEINRPALQLAGFYESFDKDRLQVIGRVEHSFLLSLTEEKRRESIRNLFGYQIPCLIVCKDLEIFPEMMEYGREFDVPIFRTDQITTDFTAELIFWLREELADRVMMHGVLVDIYGEGVLITGASGIGKSETALELIKRGHRLIADDAVEIKKIADRRLIGSCPEIIRYLIELRGIGIINVKELYGVGSVKDQKTVDLVIRLEVWDGQTGSYDRLGLKEEYMDILGNKVLCNTIPVRPGRNVAIICESAAMTNRQKKMGKNTAQEFADRIGK